MTLPNETEVCYCRCSQQRTGLYRIAEARSTTLFVIYGVPCSRLREHLRPFWLDARGQCRCSLFTSSAHERAITHDVRTG